MTFTITIRFEVDDGPPVELVRETLDVVDPDTARAIAVAKLDALQAAHYEPRRLLVTISPPVNAQEPIRG
jgi:hypothetical protein